MNLSFSPCSSIWFASCIFKYILLILLLQLSHFPPFIPLHPVPPSHQHSPSQFMSMGRTQKYFVFSVSYTTGGKHKARGPNPALHLVLSPATCFYLAAAPSSHLTVKEQLHVHSPQVTFGPLKATARLMWPPVKMSLTPLSYTIQNLPQSILCLPTMLLIPCTFSPILPPPAPC